MKNIEKGPFRLVIGTKEEFIPENMDWTENDVVFAGLTENEEHQVVLLMENKPVFFPGDPVFLLDDNPGFRIKGEITTLHYHEDGNHSYDFGTEDADHWYSTLKDRPAHYFVDENSWIRSDNYYGLPWVKLEEKNKSSITATNLLVRLGFTHVGLMKFRKSVGGAELEVQIDPSCVKPAMLKINDNGDIKLSKALYSTTEDLYNALIDFHPKMTQIDLPGFRELF